MFSNHTNIIKQTCLVLRQKVAIKGIDKCGGVKKDNLRDKKDVEIRQKEQEKLYCVFLATKRAHSIASSFIFGLQIQKWGIKIYNINDTFNHLQFCSY